MLEKRKAHAFGKDVYLLGMGKDGTLYWLEAASWDCNWYWGFGYIETYTRNECPNLSKDIQSYQHWDSFIVGKHESYNFEKKCWEMSRDYIHHLNDNPEFEKTVLTDRESWKLAELMKRFYTLRETAELFHKGGAGISESDDNLKNPEIEKEINEVLLPNIFSQVYDLLSPEKEQSKNEN